MEENFNKHLGNKLKLRRLALGIIKIVIENKKDFKINDLISYSSSLYGDQGFEFQNKFLKKELIRPTKIYVQEVLKLIDRNFLNGCANITGGGLVDNVPRVIPEDVSLEVNINSWNKIPIFDR